MDNYLPLITGLIGALIGAGTSIVTIWLQLKSQERRERVKLASELALEDVKQTLEIAKTLNKRSSIPPLSVYQHYHLQVLDALEKRALTKEKLQEIMKENKSVIEAIPNPKEDAQPENQADEK